MERSGPTNLDGPISVVSARVGDGIARLQGEKDVEKAMEGVDQVVHTAAALPLYSPQDIYTTDVEGTRMVLEVAHRHNVQRVVMISSTAGSFVGRVLTIPCGGSSFGLIRSGLPSGQMMSSPSGPTTPIVSPGLCLTT